MDNSRQLIANRRGAMSVVCNRSSAVQELRRDGGRGEKGSFFSLYSRENMLMAFKLGVTFINNYHEHTKGGRVNEDGGRFQGEKISVKEKTSFLCFLYFRRYLIEHSKYRIVTRKGGKRLLFL